MPKKILTILLVSVIVLPSFYGCKKHTNKPAVEQLPAATQYGANTFGCLVNGKVFVPKGKFGSINPIFQCYYQLIYSNSPNGYVFNVSAKHSGSEECQLDDVSLGTDSLAIHEGSIYQLVADKRGGASAQYTYFASCSTLENTYKTNKNTNGELTITKFDEINQIVSGTFWFTAVNMDGDTVKVTDGRFDMKFTR